MKTILVVDDELAIAEMLQAFLEGEGYQVARASNGQEALAILSRSRADLVISDVMMPQLDGRGLSHALSVNSAFGGIPLVLMSALGETIVGEKTNYDAFLQKPFHLEDVLALVSRLIGPPAE
jgi:CheY-like chemotaxis protein